MNVTDIAFTGYPVTDLQRARRFYEGVLGLKESRFFGEGDKGFVEYDIGSNTLGMQMAASVLRMAFMPTRLVEQARRCSQ